MLEAFILASTNPNITKNCSLIYQFSAWKLQAQNMLCTWIVLNVKTKTKKQLVYATCSELVVFMYSSGLNKHVHTGIYLQVFFQPTWPYYGPQVNQFLRKNSSQDEFAWFWNGKTYTFYPFQKYFFIAANFDTPLIFVLHCGSYI